MAFFSSTSISQSFTHVVYTFVIICHIINMISERDEDYMYLNDIMRVVDQQYRLELRTAFKL